MKKIAILASGNGSNAENIIRHFSRSPIARVCLVVSDNSRAFVLQRASTLGVDARVVPRAQWREGSGIVGLMTGCGIDYVVLAGFLTLIPPELVESYRGRMVNIHPALLPAYGGKGMYGNNVHRAVVEAREKESGITIHHVNESYDQGAVIAQYRVPVGADDTPETLAAKIHSLEYEHFPVVVEKEIRRIFEPKNTEP